MQLAVVCQIANITTHPDADKLELVTLRRPNPHPVATDDTYLYVTVVTGPHYRIGQLGIHVAPGSLMPGYLAEESWLVGRGGSYRWYFVQTKTMRGVPSPGVFLGQWYRKDADDQRSVDRFELQRSSLCQIRGDIGGPLCCIQTADHEGDHQWVPDTSQWTKWRCWRDHWKLGEDVSAYLGIRAA